MSKLFKTQTGFAPLIIVLLIAIAFGAGILYQKKLNFRALLPSKPSPSVVASPDQGYNNTQNLNSSNSAILDNSTVGTYTNFYGRYRVKYPISWSAANCYMVDSGQDEPGCAVLSPKPPNVDQGLIFIYTSPSNEPVFPKPNFSIPSLNNSLNAYYEATSSTILNQTSGEEVIFVHNGIRYNLESDFDQAKQWGFTNTQTSSYLKQIAQSLTFLNTTDPSTCDSPKLTPLHSFPDNFVLDNLHPEAGITDSFTTERHFRVVYQKSGDSFTSTSDFLKTVALINPSTADKEEDGTSIQYINCAEKAQDVANAPLDSDNQGYHISTDPTDPFGVLLYGSADNPQKLWSQKEWTTLLLTQTRSTVYIKQGNNIQKYTAVKFLQPLNTCCFGGKPAIYLYPPKEENVKVTIKPKGGLLKTDNLYNPALSGWDISAKPSGLINNSLNYLYYEAWIKVNRPQKGYMVSYQNLFDFSKSYVQRLGLNEKESQEFIKFWKAKLPYSPYYFVSHLNQDQISKIYPLEVSPKPDTLLRVELYFEPVSKMFEIDKPKFESVPQRTGFTAVEWGAILNF